MHPPWRPPETALSLCPLVSASRTPPWTSLMSAKHNRTDTTALLIPPSMLGLSLNPAQCWAKGSPSSLCFLQISSTTAPSPSCPISERDRALGGLLAGSQPKAAHRGWVMTPSGTSCPATPPHCTHFCWGQDRPKSSKSPQFPGRSGLDLAVQEKELWAGGNARPPCSRSSPEEKAMTQHQWVPTQGRGRRLREPRRAPAARARRAKAFQCDSEPAEP